MLASIVQFPHPGGEHDALTKQPVFPWNTGKHQRKFMRVPATYLAADNTLVNSDVVLWGEWEAPSKVVRSWPASPCLPTFLHEPFWEVPEDTDPARQNTDPWVFGDCFRYSNCKQLDQNGLLNLKPGSLVLFGSTVGGRFVLDTCFVAASSTALTEPPFTDHAFEVCTTGALDDVAHKLRLHCGATPDKPVHNMFSFSPCLPDEQETPRFRRPEIKLDDLINPASKQSPRGANAQRPIKEVVTTWESVVSQVRQQGLALGVKFETPPRINTPTPRVTASSKAGTGAGC